MMINRDKWMRENAFKNMAHLLTSEIMELPGMYQGDNDPDLPITLEKFLAERLYECIVPHILDAALKRFQEVARERLEQGEPIYINVPDLTQWADSYTYE